MKRAPAFPGKILVAVFIHKACGWEEPSLHFQFGWKDSSKAEDKGQFLSLYAPPGAGHQNDSTTGLFSDGELTRGSLGHK